MGTLHVHVIREKNGFNPLLLVNEWLNRTYSYAAIRSHLRGRVCYVNDTRRMEKSFFSTLIS